MNGHELAGVREIVLEGRSAVLAVAEEFHEDPLDVALLLGKALAVHERPTPCGRCGADAALDDARLCSACSGEVVRWWWRVGYARWKSDVDARWARLGA